MSRKKNGEIKITSPVWSYHFLKKSKIFAWQKCFKRLGWMISTSNFGGSFCDFSKKPIVFLTMEHHLNMFFSRDSALPTMNP